MTTAPLASDPRPRVRDAAGGPVLDGGRCDACGYRVAVEVPRCPSCGAAVSPAAFGPGGAVWSHTTVRIPTPGRTPPYVLAYVDLDDGPRVLAHVRGDGDRVPAVGDRVALSGTTPTGDVEVELA